eukprot:767252-Hanusia_phi.AAC.2
MVPCSDAPSCLDQPVQRLHMPVACGPVHRCPARLEGGGSERSGDDEVLPSWRERTSPACCIVTGDWRHGWS